jgi:uncharacterized protein (TIGR02246 family)
VSAEVEAIYHQLLEAWNERNAAAFASVFTDDGSIVGFDGSTMAGANTIEEHLAAIFRDHTPPTYLSVIEEVRSLTPKVTLLRAIAGMVPPNGDAIESNLNAIHGLLAVQDGERWRVAHFVSTPARFDGRPDAVEEMTRRLRAAQV